MAPRGAQDGRKTEKQHRPNIKEGWRRIPRPILNENVANMEPSWHENPAQINAYVDNLEDQNKFEKAMKDKRKLTTVRRAERPGA